MCLDTAIRSVGGLLLPAKWKIRGGDNLDKVHVVKVGIAGFLVDSVQRIEVVVGPRNPAAHSRNNFWWQLWSKSQRVDDMSEIVRLHAIGEVPVVLEIVDVHVTIAEASAGSKMEVSNDLVDLQQALNTATLFPLLVQSLRVMLPLALLHTLASAKGPRRLRISLSNLVTGIAAARLLSVGRRSSSVTATTVVGIQVLGLLMQLGQRVALNHATAP